MKKYISESYIEEKIGFRDTSAMIISMLSLITILLGLFKLPRKSVTKNSKKNEDLTIKLRNITENENITVYEYPDNKNPDAFTFGHNDVFYSTAMNRLLRNEKELIAILLHETGHVVRKHAEKQARRTGISTVMLMAIIDIALISSGISIFVMAVQFIIASAIVYTYTGDFYDKLYTKKQELESDSYAKKFGYERELASALSKLEKYIMKKICTNMSDVECHRLIDDISRYTNYPTFKERADNLLKNSKVINFMRKNIHRPEKVISFLNKLISKVKG